MESDEVSGVDVDTTDGPDDPEFRATVQQSGAVRLVPWGPWLNSSGPLYTLMAARDRAGIGIADLRVIRDEEGTAVELIAAFHSGGGDVDRKALCDWAQAVGYRRVWFDRHVIDLEPTAQGPVTTCCPGCCQEFLDGRSGGFWHRARRCGAFPWTCPLCGSDLPQWTPRVRDDIEAADRASSAADRPSPKSRRSEHS